MTTTAADLFTTQDADEPSGESDYFPSGSYVVIVTKTIETQLMLVEQFPLM